MNREINSEFCGLNLSGNQSNSRLFYLMKYFRYYLPLREDEPMHFRSLVVLPTLLIAVSHSFAVDDSAIQSAIKKGAKYLQDIHKPSQNYYGGSHQMGSACLAGLALLEAGVDEDDASLKNIIDYVRDRALSQTKTYEASLTIMFLDRLGKKTDVPFIQFLGIRLQAGQGQSGGWSYGCGYPLTEQETARLKGVFLKDAKRSEEAPGNLPKDAPPAKERPRERPRSDLPVDPNADPDPKPSPKKEGRPAAPKPAVHSGLHPEVVKWMRRIQSLPNDNLLSDVVADNSNTQFAVLGLWCARKHGVPCDQALAAIGKLCRFGQLKDGGWTYPCASALRTMPIERDSTPSMTCAGLIGLAASLGTQHVLKSKPDSAGGRKSTGGSVGIIDDAAVRMALKCLAEYISQSRGEARGAGPMFAPNQGSDDLSGNLYFLWSLERTAVIYDLETIGKHDWYAWGSKAILKNQKASGSWGGTDPNSTSEDINTCFAILFLCRANVAKDLTAKLTGRGKVKIGSDVPTIKAPPADSKKDTLATVEHKKEPIVSKPPAEVEGDFEKEATRLSKSLISATAETRPAILAKMRDSKGGVFTEALVRAIGKLEGEARIQTRDALAKRLSRMTAGTLREMLNDENREVRRAASLACASKKDKQFIPDLIGLLADKDELVAGAAHIGLRELTEKDFGPEPNATEADKAKAIRAWKSWWASQR